MDVMIPLPVPLPGPYVEPGPAVEFVFCIPADGVSGDGSTIGIDSLEPEGVPAGVVGLGVVDVFGVFGVFVEFGVFAEFDEFVPLWPEDVLSPVGSEVVFAAPFPFSAAFLGFVSLRYFL